MQALESECLGSHPGLSTCHLLGQVTVTPGVCVPSCTPDSRPFLPGLNEFTRVSASSVSTRVLVVQVVIQLLYSWSCGQGPGSFASDPEKRAWISDLLERSSKGTALQKHFSPAGGR